MSLQLDKDASQRKLDISSVKLEGDTKLTISSATLDGNTKLDLVFEIADGEVTFDKDSLKKCLKEAYSNILNIYIDNIDNVKKDEVKTIDDIYNPKYYNKNGLSPIEAFKMGLLSQEEYIGFLKGNIIKYSVRCDDKNREEDMEKCKTYTEYLREELKSEKQEITRGIK